jgi:hypothetical protein
MFVDDILGHHIPRQQPRRLRLPSLRATIVVLLVVTAGLTAFNVMRHLFTTCPPTMTVEELRHVG